MDPNSRKLSKSMTRCDSSSTPIAQKPIKIIIPTHLTQIQIHRLPFLVQPIDRSFNLPQHRRLPRLRRPQSTPHYSHYSITQTPDRLIRDPIALPQQCHRRIPNLHKSSIDRLSTMPPAQPTIAASTIAPFTND